MGSLSQLHESIPSSKNLPEVTEVTSNVNASHNIKSLSKIESQSDFEKKLNYQYVHKDLKKTFNQTNSTTVINRDFMHTFNPVMTKGPENTFDSQT